jgi:glycosyltransferase involved in cell wall biosynthesis
MISILLATYNGEKYIKESIDSIINQSFKDWELLIGFNGTTDSSKDIISEYNDQRIKYFNYDDKGKSKTLNKLLLESKYDWIAIQDDDDIWDSNKLEKQVEYLNGYYDVVGSFIRYINENGVVIGGPQLSSRPDEIKEFSLNGINQIANTSAVVRKSSIIKMGGWKDGLDGIEDYDLWLRLMRSGGNFINIPENLVSHRLHKNSNFNTKEYNLGKIL